MDRIKTFLKYALWVIAFAIFSEFIINVGLNSSYKKIERKEGKQIFTITKRCFGYHKHSEVIKLR